MSHAHGLARTAAVVPRTRPESVATANGLAPSSGLPHRLEHISLGSAPLQRLVLSIGDLAAMTELAKQSGKELSEDQRREAQTVTNAVKVRTDVMKETAVRLVPSDIQNVEERLSKIGSEELRIIAHGDLDPKAGRATVFGSFTPDGLVGLLADVKLPKAYPGTIMLLGCHTAVGPNNGYLGQFFEALRKAGYAQARARGTRGALTIEPDGTELVTLREGAEQYHAQLTERTKQTADSATAFKSLTGILDAAPPRAGADVPADVLSAFLAPTTEEAQAAAAPAAPAAAAAAANADDQEAAASPVLPPAANADDQEAAASPVLPPADVIGRMREIPQEVADVMGGLAVSARRFDAKFFARGDAGMVTLPDDNAAAAAAPVAAAPTAAAATPNAGAAAAASPAAAASNAPPS